MSFVGQNNWSTAFLSDPTNIVRAPGTTEPTCHDDLVGPDEWLRRLFSRLRIRSCRSVVVPET